MTIIFLPLQDFDWMISKTVKGDTKIKIISTFDPGYSDPSFSKRVASGDISVVRLADNEVELKIAEVKSQDAGFYWCQTPSTDSIISGNYDDQVQLIGMVVCVCACMCDSVVLLLMIKYLPTEAPVSESFHLVKNETVNIL